MPKQMSKQMKIIAVLIAIFIVIGGVAVLYLRMPGTEKAPTPSVTVRDQFIENGRIIIDEVVANQSGWIVIHNNTADDAPGPVVGHAAVERGANTNVSVQLDTEVAFKLWAMLHLDTGEEGVYEFPDADPPVKVEGQIVVQPFNIIKTLVTVDMENLEFVPETITIQVGTTVKWINKDSVDHTVTSGTRGNPTDLFDSGDVGAGETFQYTFTNAGTYDYYCKYHPGMEGVVNVEG
ncbi:MAG: cupredoxin family copper-binding protein [Candidatus Korarchaeota archaeon]|nr:cupredoxin family copper-binding protein [Candidatus Korarchaeota archaeon]NIU82409.1 hypothetical protein [Candidatus Thorarchaeota archaeon]NIW12882.1 hypothetical protein [Candidatus Thorarchaeota archaeon]NIW51076.1 hypothetical protein [Candidatus Korarchaeota archaeon]